MKILKQVDINFELSKQLIRTQCIRNAIDFTEHPSSLLSHSVITNICKKLNFMQPATTIRFEIQYYFQDYVYDDTKYL
jgi:hypothetical protein